MALSGENRSGELPAGEVRDHRLIRQIGAGAYGEVWLAENALGTLRAVKIVYRDRFEDERPYLREFEGVRSYEPVSRAHEGLIDILQVGIAEAEGRFYYVMELADTDDEVDAEYRPRSLRSVLVANRGRIPVLEACRIGERLALALQFLHESGLVHRDVKPSNILFVGGEPKLADAGLVTDVTGADSSFGTEGYVPKQNAGEATADLYALGMALYEATSGLHRREFPSFPEEFESLREKEAYAELNQILLKACSREAKDRFASAEEMRAELLLAQAGRSIRGLRVNARHVRLLRRVALGLALASALVSAGYFWQRRETARNRAIAESESRIAAVERENAQRLRENLYASDLAAAQALVAKGNRGGANRLLQHYLPSSESEPDLRSFDWYWLSGQLADDAHEVLADLGSIVRYCRYEPDGALLLCGLDGKVWSWKADGGFRILAQLPLGEAVFYVGRLPDGKLVLGGDAGLRLADGPSLVAGGSRFWDVSPDGRWAVGTERFEYGASRNEIVVSDLSGKESQLRLATTADWAAFSPDGRSLLTAVAGGGFRLFDVVSGFSAQRDFEGLAHPGVCLGIAFSADGRRAVAGLSGGELGIWDVETGRLLHEVSGSVPDGVWQPRFSPDGARVAAACGQEIWVVDAETGSILHRLKGHSDDANCVSFSNDGSVLASGGKDGVTRLWSLDNGSSRAGMVESVRMRNPPVVSSDGSRMAGVSFGESVRVLDARSGKVKLAFGSEHDWPALFSADGSELATTVRFWDLRRWDLATGRVVSELLLEPAGEPGSGVVAAKPDGSVLVGGLESGKLVVWDMRSGTLVRRLAGHTQSIARLAFSMDGKWLASSGYDRRVFLWDTETWEGRRLAEHGHNALGLAFSADGRWLATASWDGMARVFDLPSGSLLRVVRGETSSLDGICFTPDGKTLAMARADHSVALVDTRTWRETIILPGNGVAGELHYLVALPDGSAFFGYSDDGRDGRIWRLPKKDL